MKRDSRLRSLSRDHHHALALARRATLAATGRNPSAPQETWDEVVRKFDDELLPHFEIEERYLLPALTTAGEEALVARVLDDHRALRDLVQGEVVDLGQRLAEFGTRLAEHVRFEERVLFAVAESTLSDDELEAISAATPVLRRRTTTREEAEEGEHSSCDTESPHVVIVGGGFGGLAAARDLRRAPLRITLIDRQNHHLFQPLLYQVATAGLSSNEIAYPIRNVLRRQENVDVFMAEVTSIDVQARRIVLRDRTLGYDYLILAPGARPAYFGHPEWEARSSGLKDLHDALEIRQRILRSFEKAEFEADPRRRQALLTFVIVGAGPTGVELAGALGELACNVMRRDFRRIDSRTARIVLVEAGLRVLPTFPEDLSAKAERSLRKLCVEVRTNSAVTSMQPGTIVIGQETVFAETVIWAAGVQPSPLGQTIGSPLDRSGRVLVQPDLSVPAHPEVFVIGDLAVYLHQTGKPLAGLAPVAVQQGRHAAHNIVRLCDHLATRPFHYVDRGVLATIGRGTAVANFRGVGLSGFSAWIAWALVHIFQLIGFRNRFVVMFEWAWAYFTFQRSARLIIRATDDDSASSEEG